MSIADSIRKGFGVAGKNLLVCLISLLVIFIGFIMLGILVAVAIISSNFPQITAGMTPQEVSALNWAQVNWALFIPLISVIMLMGGILISFTQGGILAFIRDCVKVGMSNLSNFFKSGAKYLLKVFSQYLIIGLIGLIFMILGIIFVALVGLAKIAPLAIAAGIIIQVLLVILMLYMVLILVYGQISLITGSSGAIKSLGEGRSFLNKNLGKTILLFMPFALIFVIFYVLGQGLTGVLLALPVLIQLVLNFVVSFLQIIVSVAMMASFMTFYLETK